VKRKKFTIEERKYWSQVALLCSQITFGVLWATIIIPKELDQDKVVMVSSNLIASLSLWYLGWTITKRK
jgi:hypothetical protein